MRKGTLVYSEDVVVGEVADDTLHLESSDDESEEDEEQESGRRESGTLKGCTSQHFFNVALEIRELLRKTKGTEDWPPDAHDLTPEKTLESLPVKLFNFVAWILGYSEEPDMEARVRVKENEKPKVVSMCQDLVYAEAKGRKQTPKSLALGMTVSDWLTKTSPDSSLIRTLFFAIHCVIA